MGVKAIARRLLEKNSSTAKYPSGGSAIGNVNWGIPESCIDVILAACRIDTAVETGTYMGSSTELLAQRCREVITIEGDQALAAAATRRLGRLKNVRVLQADSRAVLPEIVRGLQRPALFWLDSHYCGRGTFGATAQCPVLDELGAVVGSALPHVILIDDARLFLSPPPRVLDAGQWPSIDAICRTIDDGVVRRRVVIHDDVIIAVPESLFPQFERWLLDVADARFMSGERTLRSRWRRFVVRLGIPRLLGRAFGK